jgi:glutathione S-transferase
MINLIIGDKQYSSWSIRGVMLLKELQINYNEINLGSDWPIKVYDNEWSVFNDTKEYGFPVMPASGCCCELSQLKSLLKLNIDNKIVSIMHRVPVLYDSETNIVISDIMTIAYYLKKIGIAKNLFGSSLENEMQIIQFSNHIYSDFLPLMSSMSYGKSFYEEKDMSDFDNDTIEQVNEIQNLVEFCLNNSKGSFLFGDFSLADIMFAPLAFTFMKNKVPMKEICKNYVEELLNRKSIKESLDEANKIYIDKNKYDKNTLNWIANQFRVHSVYPFINRINNCNYHKLSPRDFNVFMDIKNGYSISDCAAKNNVLPEYIEELFKIIWPEYQY